MLVNFFLILINLLILIFGYLIIKKKLDDRYLNNQVIKEIKDQMDKIIVNMNSTTEKNITMIEEGKKELNELINTLGQISVAIEHKQNLLNDTIKKAGEAYTILRQQNNVTNTTNPQTNTYSITKQPKPVEVVKRNEEAIEKKQLETILSKMNKSEQIAYLINLGWDDEKIKTYLNISSGEYELAKELSL